MGRMRTGNAPDPSNESVGTTYNQVFFFVGPVARNRSIVRAGLGISLLVDPFTILFKVKVRRRACVTGGRSTKASVSGCAGEK